jgi:hypothetical protein
MRWHHNCGEAAASAETSPTGVAPRVPAVISDELAWPAQGLLSPTGCTEVDDFATAIALEWNAGDVTVCATDVATECRPAAAVAGAADVHALAPHMVVSTAPLMWTVTTVSEDESVERL